jgi:hypothetical protein
VVAPGMSQNPLVKSWLGGVEPAWTLLDDASFAALTRPPSPTVGPIRLASDLTEEEIQHSVVARSALILIRAAAVGPGLKTTATGNLSRSVVAEMYDRFTWPGFDKANDFPFLRKHKGHLTLTPAGRRTLEPTNSTRSSTSQTSRPCSFFVTSLRQPRSFRRCRPSWWRFCAAVRNVLIGRRTGRRRACHVARRASVPACIGEDVGLFFRVMPHSHEVCQYFLANHLIERRATRAAMMMRQTAKATPIRSNDAG